mgnify:CR=1 FL=1
MAVTHTDEGVLDAMSTAVLIARLHREGKLRPVFGQLTPVLKYRAWRVTPPIST